MKKILIPTMIIAAAAMIAAALLYPKNSAYQKAIRLQEQGEYGEAYEIFSRLGSWRDSGEQAKALALKNPQLPLLAAGRWDLVTLGRYEQDAEPENGSEPLEWYVLYREQNDEKGGTDLLLLSRYCIACKAYHTPVGDTTWESSRLRAYLNDTFYQDAFDDTERSLIRPTVNENTGNELLHIDGGPDTEDRVFLLSGLEYGVYFQQEDAKWLIARAEPTPQAVQEGIYVSGQDPKDREDLQEDEEGYSRWWLRGPGNEAYSAIFVEEDGEIFEGGAAVDIDYTYGLRPALWVHLER